MKEPKNIMIIVLLILVLGLFFYEFTKVNRQLDTREITTEEVLNEKKEETKTGKSLDLSNKNLDKLPSNVLGQTDLEHLDLSNNNLSGALPSEIGKLTKLKTLIVKNNKMTGVPAEVGKLSNLEILDLSNNQLTGLPNELANLKKLKKLDLRGNNYSVQDLEIIKKGLSLDAVILVD